MTLALPAAMPVGAACPIVATTVSHFRHDRQRVAMPHVEAQVVVRFGPALPGGVDVHAMGPGRRVLRKFIRAGHRAILVRLRPGTYHAALGVPAANLSGHPIALDDLWGHTRTQRLLEQLAGEPDARAAATLLERAIKERTDCATLVGATPRFLHKALQSLQTSGVTTVAHELGVSERHLRRVLQQTLGVGPKTYARLKRFARAVHAAQSGRGIHWSAIAADAGYYDQAHLIADFRSIAGTTPQLLLAELRDSEQAAHVENDQVRFPVLR
ncbi:helix-turn-helix domain-containing protein [Dokdonella sp.]|uniref:helix-turn-helix domain-containing protein n=1 Tax=Dokdonella sp. TaxID=2291710 RepID=UPI002D7E4129|nr:helix-turn-helix domain-containing protein [Dokdonella sp.]